MATGRLKLLLALTGLLITVTVHARATAPNSAPRVAPAPTLHAPHAIEANGSNLVAQPCKKGEDNRSSELCAQWKAADAAEDASQTTWVLGGLGTLIGGLTLAAAWRAATWAKKAAFETERSAVAALAAVAQTTEANQIARAADARAKKDAAEQRSIALEASQLEHRAWLYPKIKQFDDILYTERGVQLNVTYEVRNRGRTHGELIFHYAQLASTNIADVVSEIHPILLRLEGRTSQELLFPDEMALGRSLTFAKSEHIVPDRGGVYSLTLVITVVYRVVGSEDFKYTMRSFSIHPLNEQNNPRMFVAGEIVGSSRLGYTSSNWGNAAT